jgi:hypothetical protein
VKLDAETAGVNQFAPVEDLMRRGGLDPVTEPHATNPVKQIDLAYGGTVGKIENRRDELTGAVQAARKAGVDEGELQDVLNLNAMEHATKILQDRARQAAGDRTLTRAAARVGRQPRQQALFDAPKPEAAAVLDPASELDELTKSLGVSDDALKSVQDIDPATSRVNASGESAASLEHIQRQRGMQDRGETFVVYDRAGRRRPLDTPDYTTKPGETFGVEGPQGFRVLDDQGGRAPAAVRRSSERQPRQPRLPGAAMETPPTSSPLVDVPPQSTPLKRPMPNARIAEIAAEEGLTPEQTSMFVRRGEKRGLSEPAIRAEMRQGIKAAERARSTAKDAGLEAGDKLPQLKDGRKITPAVLQQERLRLTTELGEKFKPTQEAAQRIVDIGTRALHKARELVPEEVYAKLVDDAAQARVSATGEYVPLKRLMDEMGTAAQGAGRASGVSLPKQHVIRRLMGSRRTSKNPYQAMYEHAATVESEVARNQATKSLAELRHRGGVFAEEIRPLKSGEKPPAGFGVVTYLEKGIPQRFAVPDRLAQAMSSFDGQTDTIVMSALRLAATPFRAGVTAYNLRFGRKNVQRDVQDWRFKDTSGSELARHLPSGWKDWREALEQVWNKSPEYREFYEAGGGFAGFQKNLGGGGWLRLGSEQPKTLRMGNPAEINSAFEDATKLMTYKKMRANGMSKEDAAWWARRFGGSPDFARRGSKMQELNILFPFLNAQTQGLARDLTWMQKFPKKAVFGAASITGKVIALQMYNNSFTDPDGTRSWDRLSDYERRSNFIVFLPGMSFTDDRGTERNYYVRIPIGHTVNLIRAPIQALVEPNRKGSQIAESLTQGLPMSPSTDLTQTVVAALNPGLRIPAEQYANRQAFFDQPIVSRSLEGVGAGPHQYTDRTSEASKWLARQVNKLPFKDKIPTTFRSPARLDHFLGWGGGVADEILDTIDSIVRREPRVPILASITKDIVGGSTPDQQAKDWGELFYDSLQRSNEARATVNKLSREGEKEQLNALANDPDFMRDYARASVLNRASTALAEVRKRGDRKAELAILKEIATALEKEQE